MIVELDNGYGFFNNYIVKQTLKLKRFTKKIHQYEFNKILLQLDKYPLSQLTLYMYSLLKVMRHRLFSESYK